MNVALVGASPVLAALQSILGDECALAVPRTTADHVAQAVGADGAAVLDLPAGESREFARALGALGIRVLDLGPDLRVAQVSCALLDAAGKRVAAMPSPPAAAAWLACGPLLKKGVMHPDRLVVQSLSESPGKVAAELGWILDQAGFPPTRRMDVALHGRGVLALVVGEVGGDAAFEDGAARAAYDGSESVRLCPPGIQPDPARIQGGVVAEVSVAVDEFAEFVVCACALDPESFTVHSALRALRQMAG